MGKRTVLGGLVRIGMLVLVPVVVHAFPFMKAPPPSLEVVELAGEYGLPVYQNRIFGDALEKQLRERKDLRVIDQSALRAWHDARPFTPPPGGLETNGPNSGTDFLILVKAPWAATGGCVTAAVLDCANGNVAAEFTGPVPGQGPDGQDGIARRLSADIAGWLRDAPRRRVKTAAILAVVNTAEPKQLDDWAGGLVGRLERAAAEAPAQVLKREQPGLTRFETDLRARLFTVSGRMPNENER